MPYNLFISTPHNNNIHPIDWLREPGQVTPLPTTQFSPLENESLDQITLALTPLPTGLLEPYILWRLILS